MIELYQDVLTWEEHVHVYNILTTGSWIFGRFSKDLTDGYTFWYADLNDNKFFTEDFVNKIRQRTNKNLKLKNVYANGQTYGLPGKLHKDTDDENCWTFLYYANLKWEYDWGGATVWVMEDDCQQSAVPIPNAGILFKSTILHCGNEPTRFCKDLRITIAFNFVEE